MNLWNKAQAEHRVAIVRVDDRWRNQGQHETMWALLQKFFSQTLVLQIEQRVAHRDTLYTVLSPELPATPWGSVCRLMDLEIDLVGHRTPTAWVTEDRLLKVSL